MGCDQLHGDFLPNVTPDRGSKPTAAKSYAQHRPAAAGRTPEQGAAPTGAADSLPPAGAGVGAEDSPNCVKDEFYGGNQCAHWLKRTVRNFWRR